MDMAMAGHYSCTKQSAGCLMSSVYVVDNERLCCLQEAGKQLHIDPTLAKVLFLLPSLHNMGQGGVDLHVEHPLRGAGSAPLPWALDCATLLLQVPQISFHI